MTSSDNDMNQFVPKALISLMASPHITMPKSGHILMGPGPIDLFSTRFINTFTDNVKAKVLGDEVTRDGLKESLLSLQKYWNPKTVQFCPEQPLSDDDCVRTSYTWTTDSSEELQIQTSARVVESGGKPMIDAITLDGESSLFRSDST